MEFNRYCSGFFWADDDVAWMHKEKLGEKGALCIVKKKMPMSRDPTI